MKSYLVTVSGCKTSLSGNETKWERNEEQQAALPGWVCIVHQVWEAMCHLKQDGGERER